MFTFHTEWDRWHVCEACWIRFVPGPNVGEPNESWEELVEIFASCRELTWDEYYGPGWHTWLLLTSGLPQC
jgi:hypothetical protein